MRIISLFLLATAGCAPASYLYGFDISDPGAQNFKDFRRPDILEDADVKVEVRADPSEFKAVAFDVTNKTEQPLQIQWETISIVGPDHEQRPLRPNAQLGPLEPGAKVSALLVPFELPSVGDAAKAYDDSTFEMVVPMLVRGASREYRYHLHVTLQKL
jgi:hypothetical protein